MDVGKAFSYVFQDDRWIGKIVVGAVLAFFTFLLIPIPLLIGWAVGVTRNVMDGLEDPMPAWEDWETLFVDGLRVFGIWIIYFKQKQAD